MQSLKEIREIIEEAERERQSNPSISDYVELGGIVFPRTRYASGVTIIDYPAYPFTKSREDQKELLDHISKMCKDFKVVCKFPAQQDGKDTH